MSTKNLFDSHCHLQFPHYDSDREDLIKKLIGADIKVIDVGTDFEDSKRAIELAQKYRGQMWATVGLHPNDAANSDFEFGAYKNLAQTKEVVAIGECGLDYFRTTDKKDQERQKEIFIKHIEIANELKKPLMIHCRPKAGDDAYLDLLEILKSENLNISGGNGTSHFFVGSKEVAKQFLNLGFYISFAGPITFASQYRELVEYVPLDKILVETDAPFAAPVPYRGKRNEPAYVEFVARKIAEVKNTDFEEVVSQTTKNIFNLFNLK